jgi:hypothetical protein
MPYGIPRGRDSDTGSEGGHPQRCWCIGRLVFRNVMERSDSGLELVAINHDVADLGNLVYLLRYDSIQSRPNARIEARDDTLRSNDREVKYLRVADLSPSLRPCRVGVHPTLIRPAASEDRQRAPRPTP